MLLVSVQQLAAPFETPWNRAIPSVVERPADARLSVPTGFSVNVFAEGLANPRHMALAPNGDVFVAESRAGEIVLLRDQDGDGVAEVRETFAAAAFPWWKGNAFLAGMVRERLVRITFADDDIVSEEMLLHQQVGRIRDVRQGPDGLIYLALENRGGDPMSIVRLEPVVGEVELPGR